MLSLNCASTACTWCSRSCGATTVLEVLRQFKPCLMGMEACGSVADLLITHLNQDLDPSNLRGPLSWLLYRHFEQGDIEGYCRSATPVAYRQRTRKMPFQSR